MHAPFSGGCACRSIRYRCTSAPVAMLNCHCADCQQSSGAPFASGVIVRTADVEITGTPAAYTVRAGSGQRVTRSFCPTCGTPLFTVGEARPEVLSIRFPTLDDTAGFKPTLDIWTSSAPAWVCLDQGLPRFPKSP